MKLSIKVFLFSFIVALLMNLLDIIFHYFTNTAVHLGYVAVKLTIIFISVYLIAQFIGINKREGIITSIFSPFMFYLYYLFAYPTLDRNIFRLDDQFYFFFAHFLMLIIAYFLVYSLFKKYTSFDRSEKINNSLFIGIPTLVFGVIFHFIPNNTLRAYNLTLGLEHNSHVIIGSILLIIAFVCFYGIIVNKNK